MSLEFSGDIIEWRGPAPYFFVVVPEKLVGEVHFAAREASYGWGCVPVNAMIDETRFTTSLIPRSGTYLVPLKDAVRRATAIALGDTVRISLQVAPRG